MCGARGVAAVAVMGPTGGARGATVPPFTPLPLPGATLLTLVAGAGFGLWVGLPVAAFASSLGATLAMLVVLGVRPGQPVITLDDIHAAVRESLGKEPLASAAAVGSRGRRGRDRRRGDRRPGRSGAARRQGPRGQGRLPGGAAPLGAKR